ncbi:unnamed protein product, partial [Ceratitis capitata]
KGINTTKKCKRKQTMTTVTNQRTRNAGDQIQQASKTEQQVQRTVEEYYQTASRASTTSKTSS